MKQHEADLWILPNPVGKFGWEVSKLIQLHENNQELPRPIQLAINAQRMTIGVLNTTIEVKTDRGWTQAYPGDIIIEALSGELYPIPLETFSSTYVTLDVDPVYPYACERVMDPLLRTGDKL